MSKNIELLQLTVKSLQDGKEGLTQFKTIFESISDLFESGDDSAALEEISNLTANLNDFAMFCSALQQNCTYWFDEESLKPLSGACDKFINHIGTMLDETEERNFIEVGDILRYDLSELMDEYEQIFGDLLPKVEEYLNELSAKSAQ